MTDKLLYIHNDNTQNYPIFRLRVVVDTQHNKPNSQNSIQVPNVVKLQGGEWIAGLMNIKYTWI